MGMPWDLNHARLVAEKKLERLEEQTADAHRELAELDAMIANPRTWAIYEVGFSTRTLTCLRFAPILTLGELADKTPAELLRLRQFGETSLAEVERVLEGLGLVLKGRGQHAQAHV